MNDEGVEQCVEVRVKHRKLNESISANVRLLLSAKLLCSTVTSSAALCSTTILRTEKVLTVLL